MIKLDIISDPICPWCYIGKAKLDRALESHPEHKFIAEWHPFQLNPDMPASGMDRREYLETKFGGKQGALKVYGQIAQAAEDAGLAIDFAKITRTPNTLDAHRLIHWAGLEGAQNAVVSALFKAYFCEGQDISTPETLINIATAAGMDGSMTGMLLAGEADKEDIISRDRNARTKGVQGVPCFIVANQYVLNGAQPADLWDRVISEIDQITQEPAT